MTAPEALSFSSASGSRLGCAYLVCAHRTRFRVPLLQTVIGYVYRRDLVPPLLHALLYGGLSSPGRYALCPPLPLAGFYPSQDVAAACIFLATKTEECGRKLRDVAKIYCSKVNRIKIEDIADHSSVRAAALAAPVMSLTTPSGSGRQPERYPPN